MPQRIAFLSVDNPPDPSLPTSLSVVIADLEAKGPATVVAEHLSPPTQAAEAVQALRSAQIVVSHTARADAIHLAQHDRCVLGLNWRCATTQWPGQTAPPSILSLASSVSLDLQTSAGTQKSNARLLCEALTLHTGKTQRSKRYLDVMIEWGAWPVFSTLKPNPTLAADGIKFARVFSETLTKLSLTTQFHLWTRPDFELIAGYPRYGFMLDNKLPAAFHIEKASNPGLASRIDAGESLCFVSRFVQDDCFFLSLQECE